MWEKKDLKEVKETLEFLVKGDHLVLLGPLVMMDNLENLDWLVAQESLGDKDQVVREEVRGPLDHKDARVKEDKEGLQVQQVFQDLKVTLANQVYKEELEIWVSKVLKV